MCECECGRSYYPLGYMKCASEKRSPLALSDYRDGLLLQNFSDAVTSVPKSLAGINNYDLLPARQRIQELALVQVACVLDGHGNEEYKLFICVL